MKKYIGSGIDVDKLTKELDKVSKNPSYIVVNENTYTQMDNIAIHNRFKPHECYIEFHGIPIAVCNKLDDGEVDLIYD